MNTLLNYDSIFYIFSIWILCLILNQLSKKFLIKLDSVVSTTENPWDNAIHKTLAQCNKKLWYLIAFGLSVQLISHKTQLTELISFLPEIFQISIVLFIMYVIKTFTSSIQDIYHSDTVDISSTIPKSSILIGSKIINTATFISGVLILLNIIGINISALLTFGGISGMAVGFAAQDFLANMLGTLSIYLDRSFTIGDWIHSPNENIEGVVEEINWRYTKIRRFNKRPIYVPNALFLNIVIENATRMSARLFEETIGIRYEDVKKVNLITSEIESLLKNHEHIDNTDNAPCFVSLKCFNEFSVDLYIYTLISKIGHEAYCKTKQELLLSIESIIESHGAQIAYPTTFTYFIDQTKKINQIPNPPIDD